jgi:hypothetical protein
MDNIYHTSGCPARVNNERNLSDYHTRVVLDEYYKSILASKNDHEYRKKLQESGTKIIEGTLSYLMNNAQCHCNGVPCTFNKKN